MAEEKKGQKKVTEEKQDREPYIQGKGSLFCGRPPEPEPLPDQDQKEQIGNKGHKKKSKIR